MPIYALNIKQEYGKEGQGGIVPHDELSGDGHTVYAHGREEAIAWIKAQAIFANVEPDDYADGRLRYSSPWTPKASMLDLLYGYEDTTHERQTIVMYPVSTLYVSPGYTA